MTDDGHPRFGPGTDRTLGDEVIHRFDEWLRTPFGTLDERYAMNLLLNSLYRVDPNAFAIVAAEHGFVPASRQSPG